MKQNMKFFGSVSLGERGQIVVPADAREELGLNSGDKLLVFKAPFGGGVVVLKPEAFEHHINIMNEQAAEMREKLTNEEGDNGHGENQ